MPRKSCAGRRWHSSGGSRTTTRGPGERSRPWRQPTQPGSRADSFCAVELISGSPPRKAMLKSPGINFIAGAVVRPGTSGARICRSSAHILPARRVGYCQDSLPAYRRAVQVRSPRISQAHGTSAATQAAGSGVRVPGLRESPFLIFPMPGADGRTGADQPANMRRVQGTRRSSTAAEAGIVARSALQPHGQPPNWFLAPRKDGARRLG